MRCTNGAAVCGNVDGTQINVGEPCTCGTITCTSSTGMYCAAGRNTCYQGALPGPPKSVDLRVDHDDTLRVTIEPPVDDGGANITHYEGSMLVAYPGKSVGELQSIPTKGAVDWEYFTMGGESYLAVANH